MPPQLCICVENYGLVGLVNCVLLREFDKKEEALAAEKTLQMCASLTSNVPNMLGRAVLRGSAKACCTFVIRGQNIPMDWMSQPNYHNTHFRVQTHAALRAIS